MIDTLRRNGKAMSIGRALAIVAFALCQTAAYGQMNHQHASEAACDETILRCASKVTPAFSPDGTLWLAWMAGGQVSVARSNDAGHSFSTPVQVTREKLNLDWGPDARPKIVVDRKGGIALAFFKIQNALTKGGIRPTEDVELAGLDVAEMGALAYPEFQGSHIDLDANGASATTPTTVGTRS